MPQAAPSRPSASQFARVFWFGVVLPRALMLGCVAAMSQLFSLPWAVILPVFLLDLAAFAWQVRRFQNAADDHVRSTGNLAPVWGGYLVILLAALLCASLWWGILLAGPLKSEEELFTDRMDRLHASFYELNISPDGTILKFDGAITFGLTRTAGQLLDANPQVSTVHLTGDGGHIYEARGFARLIRDRGLATVAHGDCRSACTMLFIAGAPRSLAPDARLGFHQYALESDGKFSSVDLKQEQEKDRAFFRRQGVSEAFLTRMYDQPSTGLWYPSREELRAAGLLTGK